MKDVRRLLINKAGAETNLPRLLYMIGNSSQLDLLAPVFLALTNVSLVTELGHLLSLSEELVSLLWECLLYREVTYLTEQEVTEVSPVRSLAIESEWVLALSSQEWVVTPQVPVTALNSQLFLVL